MRLRQIDYSSTSWNAIVSTYPQAEAFHSPEWVTFLQHSREVSPVVAEVLDEDRVVGHFVGATIRRFGARILGSPLPGWGTNVMGFLLQPGTDRREAVEALVRFAFVDLGCVHLELGDRDLAVDEVGGSSYTITTRETFEVDLTGSEDDILGRMQKRARTYVRRAERTGLHIEEASGAAFADEYYDQLVDVFASSSLVPTYGVDRVRSLIDIVGPSGQLAMHRVRDPDGQPVASILTIGRNERAALWGLAWYRSSASLHPVEPLQWAAMQYWRERGATTYDLDGITLGKGKFGGRTRVECRIAHSRHPVYRLGRNAIRTVFYRRQRLLGRLRGWRYERAQS